MVPYVDKIDLCDIVPFLREINVMRHKCHVRWHNFNFKRMLITGLGQQTLYFTVYKLIPCSSYKLRLSPKNDIPYLKIGLCFFCEHLTLYLVILFLIKTTKKFILANE